MDTDRSRWDQRWSDRGPADPGEISPTPPDVAAHDDRLLDELPTSGRALDVACGMGAQSLWMAARGLEVTALDVSPVAVATVAAAAAARGLRVDARVADTDDGLPDDLRELSLVICQRYRAPGLYQEMADRLRPGGVLVLTVLSTVGRDDPVGPYHASPGELLAAFEHRIDIDILRHVESVGQASIVVRRRA